MTISIIYKCIFVMFLMEVILCDNGPCPTILQYGVDNDQVIYGMIVVPSPDSNTIKLEVRFSIGNSTHAKEPFNGKIKFLGNVDHLKNKLPLTYRLDFPTWCNNTLPRITSISVNGESLCPGAALQGEELTTTVTLTNKLKLILVNDSGEGPPMEKPTRGSFPIENVFKNITVKNCSNNCGCSEDGTYPWFGAVFYQEQGNPKLLCGATLITPKLALTEGHCVAPYVNYILYSIFGRTNLLDWFDSNSQSRRIASVELHRDYSPDSAEGNLAILIFSSELQLSSTIRIVCLWDNSNLEEVASKEGLLLDWNKNTSAAITQHLQQNYAVVTGKDRCAASSNRTFCAEIQNNSGIRNSSSGSPFYVVAQGRWTIRGIVSGSLLKPNTASHITQYVHLLDVSKYIDWIKSLL